MELKATSNRTVDQVQIDMRDSNRDYQTANFTVREKAIVINVNYNDLQLTLPLHLGIALMESAVRELDAISQAESTS
mgnify:CR=1 FL=1